MKADARRLLKEQQKKYGKDVIFMAGDLPPLRRIPTGSLMLDAAIGGGWPLGRISEVYGLEHSGKTALLLSTIALSQKAGGDCYYSNPEKTWDDEFSKALGIVIPDLPVVFPKVGEEGMQQIIDAIISGAFTVVGLDSLNTLVPSHVLEKKFDPTIGTEAKLNNLFMRRAVLANHSCALIIINQPRSKIGGMVKLPPQPVGGQGLKHHKSISVELGKGAWLGADGVELGFGTKKEKVGFTVRFKVRKNKTFPPYKEGSYRFYFKKWKDGGVGIDEAWDIKRLARMNEIKIPKGKRPTAAQMKKICAWPEDY